MGSETCQAVDPKDMLYHYQDFFQHIEWVTEALLVMVRELMIRIQTHDRSKIVPGMERDIYARVVPEFAQHAFGSEGHKAVGRKLGPAWKHHLEHNRHHPEHFSNGVNGMNLLDLIEMLCDWKAAGLRKDGGDLHHSIDVLKDRHNIGRQLEQILRNTVRYLDGLTAHPRPWSQREGEHAP